MKLKRSEWIALIGLLLLSLVPCVGGIFRMVELGNGSRIEFLPVNPRVEAAPFPVVLHILSAVPFCILGAFQFLGSHRKQFPGWHRRAGRFIGLAGIVSALSGLWMTHAYDFPGELQGSLLYVVRIVVGVFMTASIVLGVNAVLKKKINRHRAWMARGYALGQGAGTQVLVMIPWMVVVGEEPGGLARDVLMSVAWVINLAVVELVLASGSMSPRLRPTVKFETGNGDSN